MNFFCMTVLPLNLVPLSVCIIAKQKSDADHDVASARLLR